MRNNYNQNSKPKMESYQDIINDIYNINGNQSMRGMFGRRYLPRKEMSFRENDYQATLLKDKSSFST